VAEGRARATVGIQHVRGPLTAPLSSDTVRRHVLFGAAITALGQTSASPYALMWQWSGVGGATSGISGFNGDLDTIDAIRQN